MKILVTGASGFIGHHLVARLLDKGHSVIGTTRRAGMASADSKRRLKKLESHPRTAGGALEIARTEDFESLYAVLKRTRPEACVHLAGRSWVRESIGYPDLYEDNNYRATVAVLEALRLNDCRKLVFASTVMVYGKDAPIPYMEDHLGSAPASPYGASKLASEVLVNTFNALHGVQTINLRLFSVYGPDTRPDTVPHLIASAILKGQPFTVFGDGGSMRDYIEVQDAVDAIEAALACEESCPALNVGSGFGTTVLDLLEVIETALGKHAELVYKPEVAGELDVAVPDISLAMEKLKWEPKVHLADGMRRLAAWFKSPDCPPLR